MPPTANFPPAAQQEAYPDAMPGRGLGHCAKCGNSLCVSGKQIMCSSCRLPHRHPIEQEWAKVEPPATPVFTPIDNAGTWIDRITALERRLETGLSRLATLESRLVAVESTTAPQPDTSAARKNRPKPSLDGPSGQGGAP